MWKTAPNHRSSWLYHFLPLKEQAPYAPQKPSFIKTQQQLHILVGVTTPRHCPPFSSNYDSFFVYSQILSYLNIAEIHVAFELCSLAGWRGTTSGCVLSLFVKCSRRVPLCGLSAINTTIQVLLSCFISTVSSEWCFPCLQTEIVLGNKWANFPSLIKCRLTLRGYWCLVQKSKFQSIWGHYFLPLLI